VRSRPGRQKADEAIRSVLGFLERDSQRAIAPCGESLNLLRGLGLQGLIIAERQDGLRGAYRD
jgi:hypothetical protein